MKAKKYIKPYRCEYIFTEMALLNLNSSPAFIYRNIFFTEYGM